MAIPDYQGFMLQLLKAVADGGEHPVRTLYQRVSDKFELSAAERAELLPSGGQAILENRIGWAKTYLKKAGLLESPKRGIVTISACGKEVLAGKPTFINSDYLKRFDEFQHFHTAHQNKKSNEADVTQEITSALPETSTAKFCSLTVSALPI